MILEKDAGHKIKEVEECKRVPLPNTIRDRCSIQYAYNDMSLLLPPHILLFSHVRGRNQVEGSFNGGRVQ